MRTLITGILLSLATILAGQTRVEIDLTNGGSVTGNLVALSAEGAITVGFAGTAETITVPKVDIVSYSLSDNFHKPRSQWRSRKWHATTSAALLTNSYVPGVSLTQSLTRSILPQLDAGLAASISNYRADEITNVLGISATGRYYALDSRISPYFELRGGYGWAIAGSQPISAEGGWQYTANLGYKFERSVMIWQFFVGYHQQDAGYTFRVGGETLSEIDIRYKRIAFGVELGF